MIDLAVGSVVLWTQLGTIAFSIGLATSLVSLTGSIIPTTWAVDAGKLYQKKSKEESKCTSGTFFRYHEATAFNQVNNEHVQYAWHAQEKETASRALTRSSLILDSFTTTARLIGLGALLYVMLQRILARLSTVGDFFTAHTYWNSVMGPLGLLVRSNLQMRMALQDLHDLIDVLMTQPTVSDRPAAKDLVVRGGEVSFCNVSFQYPTSRSSSMSISNITLTIEPGQRVAIVGASGSGKSTMIRLIARLFDVCKGSIAIDDQRITDVTLKSLREYVGLMPQSPTLSRGTILDNVRYGRRGATMSEVEEACRVADIHDQISRMENQYHATVENAGSNLSGGQRQRIAIARLVLHDPKIILLDEATSALDTETEARVQKNLAEKFKGRTVVTVTHRLRIIEDSDVIFVMQDGQIQESGSHASLLAHGGQYANLLGSSSSAKDS